LRPDAVILLTRVPRVLMAAIVGGALATAGAALQALLRNPLADPRRRVERRRSPGARARAASVLLGTRSSQASRGVRGRAREHVDRRRPVARRSPSRVVPLLLVGVIYNAFAGALLMFINSVVDFYQAHNVLFCSWAASATDYAVVGALALYTFIGLAMLLARARISTA
jgi:iron complex transport system permease protein